MFRSLLRSIPSISGNFTLACKLNSYIKKENKEYVSYIDDAILMPLDNNYQISKNIQINLINSKYEYDVNRYFRELSSYFYNDTYIKNNTIFESYNTKTLANNLLNNIKYNFNNIKTYFSYLRNNGLPENFNSLNNSKINNSEINLPDNRDKNFEFGCKRISYNKYQYQYQFYAPIYINSVNDLPDAFIIDIYNETNNNLLKRIRIPISKNVNLNKLRIYLTRFIEKIENNIPCVWQFDNNKIIYQHAIDCVNGGFVDFTSYNIINKNNIEQTLINDLDNLICRGYSDNNIIMSEIIPLSFLFNIDDILDDIDKYYYHFNRFVIKGYYIKNDKNYLNNDVKYDFYDFSFNYHHDNFEYDEYDPITNKLITRTYNLFNNDILYSLNEGTNYKLYYQNTFKKNYFKWKLFESDKYITNISCVYSYNKNENKFPIFKNSIVNNIYAIIENTNIIIPINKYSHKFTNTEIFDYKLFLNNNYSNWFNLYSDDNVNNSNLYSPIYNGYVYHNGILYYINYKNIKYFSVFINPILHEYDPSMIQANCITEYISTLPLYKNIDIDNYKYVINNDAINQYYTLYDNQKLNNINNDDYVYYIDNDVNAMYILYDQNILNEIIDIVNINNDNTWYTNWYNIYADVFNLIYRPISGYEKLDIDIHDIDDSYFISKIFVNNQLKSKLYYSLANKYDKRNLYYDITNNIIDINTLNNNKFTLFIKQDFLKIFTDNDFINIIYNSTNNVMSLYDKLKLLYDENSDNTNELKTYIDIIPEILNKETINDTYIVKSNMSKYVNLFIYNEIRYNTGDIIDITLNKIIEKIESTYETTTIYKILKSILAAYNIYKNLKNVANNLQKYRYIAIDNKNNININSDYYESTNNDISNLYVDYSIYNNLNLKYVDTLDENHYIYIDTIDKLNYIAKHNYQDYDNLFIREDTIDNNMNIITNIYSFKDYIISYINDFLNSRFENTEDNDENNIEFVDIDENNNPLIKIKVENNFDFIKSYIQNNDNKLYLHILFFSEYIDIPLNLYFKKHLVHINANLIDNNKLKDALLNVYKENKIHNNIKYLDTYFTNNELTNNNLNNDNNIFVELIYNDYNISQINKFKFNVLLKNLDIVNNNYIYHNPYNTLVKITYDNYKKLKLTNQLYKINDYINKYDIDFVINNDDSDDSYGYIKINYHIIKSSNNFMLKYVDDNDNIEIDKINDIEFDNNTLNNMFINIYPYLKQDILSEMISQFISNDKLKSYIKCILPTSLSYKVQYKVEKRPDNPIFTDIHKQKYNIQNIYINRYFNNISPYLQKIDSYIYNERSKIYIVNDNTTNIISDNNNIYIENINIYHHNKIHEYNEIYNNSTYEILQQYEYKHFNDNKIYNLPIEITFNHDDVNYFFIDDLEKYKSVDACFYYFKKYLNNAFSIFSGSNTNIDDIEYLFLFNKYHISYIQNDVILFNGKYKKAYNITYKLNLI